MKPVLLIIAFMAGMILPLQAGMNGKMGRIIGDPVYASLISFVIGSIGLGFYAWVTQVEFANIRLASSAHWSIWLAGIIGACYVTSVIILMPRIGAALTFGLVVAGQLTMAVFLDHYGLLGVSVQSFNWQRMAGIFLITAGVILIRKY